MICSTCSYRLGNLAVAIFGDFLTGFPFLNVKKNQLIDKIVSFFLIIGPNFSGVDIFGQCEKNMRLEFI